MKAETADQSGARPSANAPAVLRQDRVGAVLVLVLANRPVNALSADLRFALTQALMAAQDAPDVAAIVIASDTAQFSAGADMAELGGAGARTNRAEQTTLGALCRLIEDFPKPVVAAINGHAVGGGLELALAAHARLAELSAHMGLPEVHLGILPGAGGTQRLPRLVGAGPALQIMLESKPITAPQALAIGLIDGVVDSDLRDNAITYAATLVGKPPRRTADCRDGLRDPAAYRAAVVARRKQVSGARLPAASRIVDCVEAAQVLPIEQGLAFESAAFDDLVNTPEARALRHAFMAERRALSVPADLAAAALPALLRLGFWGGGERVGDVIVQALAAGLRVSLVDPRRDVVVATLERIASRQETAVAEGRMTPQSRDADWARLDQSLDAAGLTGVDMILRAPDAPALGDDPGRAPMIALGPLVPRSPEEAVALVPGLVAGLAAELCAGPAASLALRVLALALGRRLGWKIVFSGPGGPIERRLRAAITAAIAGLESGGPQMGGLSRDVIAASLAAQGIGVSDSAPPAAAPAQSAAVLSACLAALANAGARMISEGVARRPADVDAMAVFSGILPRWLGGPMFWADQRGLIVLRADLRARAADDPVLFAPDPLLDHLIRDGVDFAALNRT